MPAYELFLLIRNMPRLELVGSIKRGALAILNKNGVIRSLENMGTKELPYKIKAHGSHHTVANYFLIEFDLPGEEADKINNELSKDADYIRTCISINHDAEPKRIVECKCEEAGYFMKNHFDYFKPMTVWDKKRVFKNYGRRI